MTVNFKRRIIQLFYMFLIFSVNGTQTQNHGVCNGLVIERDIASFNDLKQCRIIDGSLTISDFKDQHIRNLSFPLLIEVTGCMKILRNDYLLSIGDLFPSLAVIRGINLTGKTALEISDNNDLLEIGLSSLRFIENGNVEIRNNRNLCFSDTINWAVIAPKSTENNIENSRSDCKNCISGGNCWSLEIPQVVCDVSCATGFCASSDICCDSECIGSCSRNDTTKCTACKNFSFNSSCVDKCPLHTFEFRNRECISADECRRENEFSLNQHNQFFIPFDGVCSENCSTGFAPLRFDLSDSSSRFSCARECFNLSITKNNVRETMKTHMGCEIVRGYVEISEISNNFCYLEDSTVRSGLNKILSSIVEIDGYLKITNSSLVEDLRFFTSLKRITGKTFHSVNYSMILANSGNYYVWLPHQNVVIEQGTTLIESNPNLCLHCQNFDDVEIKPESYTATVSWKIPTFITSSEVQNYELFIWNGTDDQICSSKKKVLQERFRTIEPSHIVYKLQPNEKFFFQLILLDSSNDSIVTSQIIQFETAQTHIKGLHSVSTSDTITIEWERPDMKLDDHINLLHYEVKAFYNPLNHTFYDSLNNCKKPTSDDSSEHRLQDEPTDLQLANYDWMKGETRDLYYKELLNLKISKDRIEREYIYEEVKPKETSVTLVGMEHNAYYYTTVRACFNKSESNGFDIECSVPSIHLAQTFPDENADQIEDLRVNSFEPNIFEVSWISPKRPNGAILKFEILYKLEKSEDYDVKTVCVSYNDFKKSGKKVIKNVTKGNYSVSVRVVSLTGYGKFSSPTYIEIENRSTNNILYLAAFALPIILSILVFYLMTQKRKIQFFEVSTNPLYQTFIYIPDDEYELDQESVVVLKEIGAGHFGKVYEGTLKHEENEIRVAVKTVNDEASAEDCANFLKEAAVMKNLKTEHIIKLLGIVSRSEPYLVVMELMANGDLKSFLRKNRPPEHTTLNNNYTSIPLKQLIPPVAHMAIQIADGMEYIANMKFVHRDLASRNCMVAADCTVKIGDFGLTRDVYESDYYRRGNKSLMPVRWMSPESLRDGIFTSNSDVFSYGVVLWEIVTYACQPYAHLSNEQVLNYIVQGGTLGKPKENCPQKIFEIMTKCWKFNPKKRISFTEIVEELLNEAPESFLERCFHCSKN